MLEHGVEREERAHEGTSLGGETEEREGDDDPDRGEGHDVDGMEEPGAERVQALRRVVHLVARPPQPAPLLRRAVVAVVEELVDEDADEAAPPRPEAREVEERRGGQDRAPPFAHLQREPEGGGREQEGAHAPATGSVVPARAEREIEDEERGQQEPRDPGEQLGHGKVSFGGRGSASATEETLGCEEAAGSPTPAASAIRCTFSSATSKLLAARL